MRNTGKIGWLLILVSCITFVIAGDALLWQFSPAVRLPFVILLAIIALGGMLVGQILVVWHDRSFFQQPVGLLLGIGLLTLNLVIFSQQSLATHNLTIVQVLYSLNLVWLIAYIFSVGFIIALFLYKHDRSVIFIGISLLVYVWAGLFYLTRVGPESFILSVIGVDGPPVFVTLTCLALWIIPIGLITFLFHSVRIVNSEINPEYLDVPRESG